MLEVPYCRKNNYALHKTESAFFSANVAKTTRGISCMNTILAFCKDVSPQISLLSLVTNCITSRPFFSSPTLPKRNFTDVMLCFQVSTKHVEKTSLMIKAFTHQFQIDLQLNS